MTPSNDIFEEIKIQAIKIWDTYDNTYGYRDEKVNYINSLTNIEDNTMVFFRMFDHINQAKLITTLSDEAINYINQNK